MELPQKFISLFFSAGLRGTPRAIHKHKKYISVISQISILKGDLNSFKEKLFGSINETPTKIRFIWLNKDYFLAVKSENSLKNYVPNPIFDFCFKEEKEFLTENFKEENKKNLYEKLKCYHMKNINTKKELFNLGKIKDNIPEIIGEIVPLNEIFNFNGSNLQFFAVFSRQAGDHPPINEIHLKKHVKGQVLNSNQLYFFASDLILQRDDKSHLLVMLRRSKIFITRNQRE